MEFAGLIFLSIMVEGLVTYISMICQNGKCHWKMIISIILGIIVAVDFNIDVFKLFGLESIIPYMSKVLTGIIIGRGSNYVADFLKTAQTYMGKTNS